jgi:hypothetical protein
VRGGSANFVRAFARLIEDHAGRLRTGAEVEEILVSDSRAVGVRIGEEVVMARRAVVANITPTQLYGRLLPGGTAPERAVRQWVYTNDRADDGKVNGSVAHDPERTSRGEAGYAYEIDRYTGASGCVLAERWLVKGLDHAHSGGDDDENWSDPSGPNAAAASYRFFQDHPKASGRRLTC